MKRIGIGVIVILTLAGALAMSRYQQPAQNGFAIKVEERNPWTHLRMNNDPSAFQFVIVSDRTGGHRSRIFSQAVEQINLLQPEFVVSVGDLIEGGTINADRVKEEWKEFQGYVNRLQMPFFYVPGNHDISNKEMEKQWVEKFGRRWYHFVYRDVLFLMLDTEDPPGRDGNRIGEEQRAYIKQALEENPSVRWTLAFMHKPIWTARDLDKNGWAEVEKMLADRPYTVFAGHVHRFKKFVRQGQNYYQLATTGGGSRLRGVEYGEFDQITWVTMKDDGPVLAHVLLDGVYTEDMKIPVTEEKGVNTANRLRTIPAKGIVYLDGCPVPNAHVTFHLVDPKTGKATRQADALTEADGTFVLTTYRANDGAPAGDYQVAISSKHYLRAETEKLPLILAPDRFADPATSGLTATVKQGENQFVFELKP
jgi:3',5'-cyclic AMP phosphodiesterase CpdA